MSQTYTDIEVILVDDGSPDNCGKICDEYANIDSRIKVIHKKNAGVNEARISGLSNSHGDYITFIDSDDYVSPLYVENLYNCIKDNDVSMACSQYVEVKGKRHISCNAVELGYFDKKRIRHLIESSFLYNPQIGKNDLNTGLCTKMIERVWVEEAMKKSIGLWRGEDLVAFLYLLYNIPSMFVSSEAHYYYVMHDGQATQKYDLKNWENHIKQWKRILDLDKDKLLKDQLPYRIFQVLKHYVRLMIENNTKYNRFVKDIEVMLNYPIIDKIVFQYDYKFLSLSDSVFWHLFYHHNYYLIYIIVKFVTTIKKY